MEPALNTNLLTELVWSENFKNLDAWNWDDLIVSAEHRTHSSNLDPVTGKVDYNQPWHKVPMRHAALYTADYRDKCQFIENEQLCMMGYAVEPPDGARFRDNFADAQDPELIHRYGEVELHGGWLSSKRRFSPGCVIQARFNAEAQSMRDHRLSLWLVSTTGRMYGQNVHHCEIDLLEIAKSSRQPDLPFNNHGLMKIVGGKIAGDSPGGEVDFKKLGIDIHKGWHDLTLVWHLNGALEFWCDGVRCNVDDRTQNDPPDGVFMDEAQFIISTEMTSGVKNSTAQSWQNRSTGPRMPEDSGLTGNSVILDLADIETHKVYIDSIHEWKILEGKAEVPTDGPVKDPVDPPVTNEELASLIQDFERRLGEQRQEITVLTLERDDLLKEKAKVGDAVRTLLEL